MEIGWESFFQMDFVRNGLQNLGKNLKRQSFYRTVPFKPTRGFLAEIRIIVTGDNLMVLREQNGWHQAKHLKLGNSQHPSTENKADPTAVKLRGMASDRTQPQLNYSIKIT